jgi:hypothetical protein
MQLCQTQTISFTMEDASRGARVTPQPAHLVRNGRLGSSCKHPLLLHICRGHADLRVRRDRRAVWAIGAELRGHAWRGMVQRFLVTFLQRRLSVGSRAFFQILPTCPLSPYALAWENIVARAVASNSKRTPEVVFGAPVGWWVGGCVCERLAQANSNHEEVWCIEWFFCMHVHGVGHVWGWPRMGASGTVRGRGRV